MNFFQAQDNARRKTWMLALLFGAAVITLLLLTNVFVAIAFGWAGMQTGMTFSQTLAQVPVDSWIWISLGVIGVIGVASLYKFLSISGGGKTIAEALGGSLIHQNTRDQKQRRLLNVVEEMALAAGMPVPPVYLIPEPSINAFAAGFSTDDAVIGINQGTLEQLSRSELQGVVAHEFSHILNGDTHINLRLIAILHGILFVGMIGYGLLRAGGYSRRNGLPIVVAGIGLLIIGYGGTFFGNLIKAAVSRQREYLADASAVQFTRDPSSIADALKKIGGFSMSSHMTNPAAEQASHMFFGAAAQKFATSLLATHPPLDKRILAIDPGWDGKFLHNSPAAAADDQARQTERSNRADTAGVSQLAGGAQSGAQSGAQNIVDQVGTLSAAGLAAAQNMISDNPEQLSQAAHDPFEARALIYAMLINPQHDQVSERQLALIGEQAETGVAPHVTRLLPAVRNSTSGHLLMLVEMSVPALKELSFSQYKTFTKNTAALITADKRVEIFEWVIHRVLTKHLHAHFEGPQNVHGRIGNINKLADDAAKLLSILASHSHEDTNEQLRAYNAGAAELDIDKPYSKQDSFDYQRLNDTLVKLRKLKPLAKPALLKACATCVLADNHVNAAEGALLQGIAATLDCPIPPSIYS
ncbi:MAG: M48 family metallopeptidase [Pseudomonadaceae bacterium]|nr:M48 family metallopeptidase [Pseudomonadaceae bacterium]